MEQKDPSKIPIPVNPDLKSPLSTSIPIKYAERLRKLAVLVGGTPAGLARKFICEGLDRAAGGNK